MDAVAEDAEQAQSQALRERYGQVKHAAMGMLARREHSRSELREKLSSKADGDQSLLERVLDELAEAGWQSDERFAESYFRSRVAQGKGPLRIRQDMKIKGLDANLIESLVDCDSSFWREQAQSVLDRKYQNSRVSDAKEKAKRLRFILSRGFPYGLVSDLMR